MGGLGHGGKEGLARILAGHACLFVTMRCKTQGNEKQRALVLCILAVVCSGIGFALPLTSTILSIVFAGFLILWANPLGLPALAILWIRAVDFSPGALVGEEQILPDTVYLAGYPLSLQLFTLGCMTVCVLLLGMKSKRSDVPNRSEELDRVTEGPVVPTIVDKTGESGQLEFSEGVKFATARLLPPRLLSWSFFLWFMFLGLTAISSLWGRSLGDENWTQPLRASMALAAFFYGADLTPKMRNRFWVMDWLLWIAAVVLALIASGLYWNHIGFLYIALGSVAFWHGGYRNWLPLGLVLGTAAVAFGFVSRSSFTVLALLLTGLLAGWLFRQKRDSWSRPIIVAWTRLVLPLTLVLAPAALLTGPQAEFSSKHEGADLVGRLNEKVYSDRAILWRAAWNAIVENPKLVSPAGRALLVDHPITRSGDGYWRVHVHNSYLEILSQTGILGGIVFLALVVGFWWKLGSALLRTRAPIIRSFGAAALVTIPVGAATGIFPFDFQVGPWVWLWAGVTVGLSQLQPSSHSALVVLRRISSNTHLGERRFLVLKEGSADEYLPLTEYKKTR